MVNNATELFPEHGNAKVGYKVFTILAEVIQDKSNLGLPAKWNRNYELSRNKHWEQPSNTISLMTANLLYTHRQRTVNMLTDSNPTFNVVKRGDPNEFSDDVYDNLMHISEFWWGDTEQQAIFVKSVLNGETYGCTVEKVVFNPDLEFNLGEVETEIVDPYHFGFYPVKSKDIQKAEAVFHFWPMSVREAQRRWPQFAESITSDEEFLKELGDTRREVSANTKGQPKGYFSTFGGVVKNMLNMSGASNSEGDELVICECWAKDYTEKEDGTPLYKGNIRVITTCNGGKIVLEDRSNPSISETLEDEEAQKTYLYDKFPFTLTQSITDTSQPWGYSDFEQLENIQIEVNKTLTQFTMFKDKVAGFKFINPKTSGVYNFEITNQTGVLNPSNENAASGLRYIDPPKMPADLIAAFNLYKEMFFLISGSFELESAQTPGQEVIAYKAIAALIEHASNMLKGKESNYGKMARERGRMYLSHVMNFYTEDRWIPIDGKEQQAINGRELIVPAKLTVVSGSTMLKSEVVRREESLVLYDKQAIDNKALLEKMGWSDADIKEVLDRMQAGPFGELFEKLSAIGVPPEILEMFQDLSQIEMKDFEKAASNGEIPSFMAMIQSMSAEEPKENPVETAELDKTNADIQTKMATVEKTMTEIELLKAKIQSEFVDQEVKKAGVNFDQTKLEIEQAQTVSDIKNAEEQGSRDAARVINGIRSEENKQKESRKQGKAGGQDSELKGKSAKSNTQGGYREKGLASNNKEVKP